MPMNQFLFDHQLAAMKIDGSGTAEMRKNSVELRGGLARKITDWRKANGLSNIGWPNDKRPPIKQEV